MTRTFVEEWVLNPRKGSINRKIDEIRGEYPYNMESGYAYISATRGTLLAVPSSYIFNCKMIYVYNGDATSTVAYLYDGASTIILPVRASAGNINVLGENELKAIIFKSTVEISVGTCAITARVGGFLYEAD